MKHDIPYRLLHWANAVNYLAYLHQQRGPGNVITQVAYIHLERFNPNYFTLEDVGYPITMARLKMLGEVVDTRHLEIPEIPEAVVDIIDGYTQALESMEQPYRYSLPDPEGFAMVIRHASSASGKAYVQDYQNLVSFNITVKAPAESAVMMEEGKLHPHRDAALIGLLRRMTQHKYSEAWLSKAATSILDCDVSCLVFEEDDLVVSPRVAFRKPDGELYVIECKHH